jgi:hypothetical protein
LAGVNCNCYLYLFVDDREARHFNFEIEFKGFACKGLMLGVDCPILVCRRVRVADQLGDLCLGGT